MLHADQFEHFLGALARVAQADRRCQNEYL
jgi:hypothetical protein